MMATPESQDGGDRDPRLAASQEIRDDLVRRIARRGRTVDMDVLRNDALRVAVARLVADGKITLAEVEHYMLDRQIDWLKTTLRDLTTR
jgi:hypothetical protein